MSDNIANTTSELVLFWVEFKAALKKKYSLPENVIRLWFDDSELTLLTGDEAVISASTDFKKTVLEKHYLDMICNVFEELMGGRISVRISSSEERKKEEQIMLRAVEENYDKPVNIYSTVGSSKILNRGAVPFAFREFTFENFIVGNSNRMAAAAAKAVAKSPSTTYNPLFIYVPSGLGKTHLLYAICQEAQKNFPDGKIVYVNGEDFTNQLIEAIRSGVNLEFREKYRACDVLLIDDIQFIAGKESTQEEFFNTFNTLYENGKQLVLASDRPPKDIAKLENRLQTRFESGLIVDIDPPDFELRSAILRRKADMLGITLPDDVVEYVASNLTANVRQLEGAVKKLYANSMLSGAPITVDTAVASISDHIVSAEPLKVSADKIIRAVCSEFGISLSDIRSRSRSVKYTVPRHTASYLIRTKTNMSYPAIGKLFNRDHSSVISSVEKAEAMLSSDPDYKERVDKILAKIQ